MTELTLTVNDEQQTIDVDPSKPLVDVLRDDLGLTGTKKGCSTGVCGACTVRIDDEPRKACMHIAGMVDGKSIETIETLSDGDDLHPVQEAFLEEFSLQCGFCTPGFIMSAVALLEENPDPTDEEIETALHGNTCRCTGYDMIFEGVKRAANEMNNESAAQPADD
ncbi:(2Fe-2S)-binding protein [Natrarchaeobius halalkaliphilus]|uniref:(2Fe-2S)-binding protein n=1 Tax=Natrarchaeobius halalkaliphilus TaxID=1679091 RepID=A0A3N6NVX0_9EURY|nr:(2Fe-2S)-binding protein [Natrarchaeobius halalkaliphilus]RQG88052.1 (2Fe-2S)-binding protein [Natrarchaeobius halalkaliphilus]